MYIDRADCSRHTGMCLEGCYHGWWDDQCLNKCGAGCQRACYQEDGACVSDCKKGLFRRFCNSTCSLGCAGETSDWLTGNCHGGCKCGYTGDNCEDTCSRHCNTPCKFDDESQCLTFVNTHKDTAEQEDVTRTAPVLMDVKRDSIYGEQCLRSCPSDTGCSSCFDEIKRNYCYHFSEVIKGVQKEDEITEASLNVGTQLSGGILVTRTYFVLFISCLALANLSKHQIDTF